MDREAKLPAPLSPSRNLDPTTHSDSYHSRFLSSSSSSSSLSSPPGFLRHVQAAFKRHRPLVTMQSNNIRPRRVLVPQREASSSSVDPAVASGRPQDVYLSSFELGHTARNSNAQTKNTTLVVRGDTHDDASITPPSISGTITNAYEKDYYPLDAQKNPYKSIKNNTDTPLSDVNTLDVPMVDGEKKVQYSMAKNASHQGADDRMATGMDILSSHMGSLALTEMEWDVSNPADASIVINQGENQRNSQNPESEIHEKSDGGISTLLTRRTKNVQGQLQHFRSFFHGDSSHPKTQSSVVGSSGATTTLVHSTSAPTVSSTTNCSCSLRDSDSHLAVESYGDDNANPQLLTPGDMLQSSCASKQASEVQVDQAANAGQDSIAAVDTQRKQGCGPNGSDILKDPSPLEDKSAMVKGFAGDVTDMQSQAPLRKNSSLNVKLEPPKTEKQEKAASVKGASAPRKRNYDPDLFFKVNGKLYQRLGKIGSGGSSEVHKVISSDCTIYALKKIKLKGRDYATAYGFCQEILYLNKLKGRDNIIQLIDYEVTDKTLLREVMNGSTSNKDGRVKDDGYIYMVLEYGEIDLAHMLSQKWRELDGFDQIDENWLRFYWQQILLAVNTIHEERIVHSDLKPANFLLVKGSLKLIDFGIAKAIMSDTTNIQRDSQVGTLSYMSPEAFMCNENDANGNTIKCGRPSDIWSLGCILYQMVYGKTPFSEYKTFWAKFKVITNQNHEIPYEQVSNPWLLDLMKKCLAWDRDERWRIPQLLQHPFLVPPVPAQLLSTQDQKYKLLQLIAEACVNEQEASMLCCQLQKLLTDPISPITVQSLTSKNQYCKLLSEMSNICVQLQLHLSNLT